MAAVPTPRRVVIAPDSFKGTASADAAARAIAEGWTARRPQDAIVLAPMADGGEGTLDAFEAAVPGAVRMPVEVTGPDGRPVSTHWLRLPDGTGVVELAATSGLTLMDRLRGLEAHTVGFGQATRAALEAGAERLVLGIGGSASTDGGAGFLEALGARLLDAGGTPVDRGAVGLLELVSVDRSPMLPPPPGGATVVTDVTNPLLGPRGAAAVFGPQKGLDAVGVRLAETALTRLADRLPGADRETPGAGAAGGTGFGLMAWGARLTPGAAVVAELLGLAESIADADVVISGEGSYDAQSGGGKTPSHVLELARRAGVPALLVAGRIPVLPDGWRQALSLGELAGSPEAGMADPLRWLRQAGELLAERAL